MSRRDVFCLEEELVVVEAGSEGAKIVERRRVPRLSGAGCSPEGALVWFVDEAKRVPGTHGIAYLARVFDETGELLVAPGEKIVTALFHGDVVYLGGTRQELVFKKAEEEWDEDRIVQRHSACVRAWDVRTRSAHVPALGRAEKFSECTVDAFAVDGERLYAFDNVMLPVFLFELEISEPARPKALAVHDVSHGLWARVRGAAMCAGFCVVLQLQGSRGGPVSTLVVFERGTFRSVARVSEPTSWNGFAANDRHAFIASARGVGVVDLGQLADDPKRPLTIRWHPVGHVDDLRLHGSTLILFRASDPPHVWTIEV